MQASSRNRDSDDDADLVRRLRAGDSARARFEALVRIEEKYGQAMYRLAVAVLGGTSMARPTWSRMRCSWRVSRSGN